jgi:hypothetical protein
MEATVELALRELLESGASFDYAKLKARAAPERPTVPMLQIPTPDLRKYDALIAGGAA